MSDIAAPRRHVRGRSLVSAVKQQLLDADGRAEEPDWIGVIERVDRKIRGGEAPRREERAEDEDRPITPLPRFRQREAGKKS